MPMNRALGAAVVMTFMLAATCSPKNGRVNEPVPFRIGAAVGQSTPFNCEIQVMWGRPA